MSPGGGFSLFTGPFPYPGLFSRFNQESGEVMTSVFLLCLKSRDARIGTNTVDRNRNP